MTSQKELRKQLQTKLSYFNEEGAICQVAVALDLLKWRERKPWTQPQCELVERLIHWRK